MPRSLAMSMLLCASATSLDDMAFFSFRMASDVDGVFFGWSVNMGRRVDGRTDGPTILLTEQAKFQIKHVISS